MILAEVRESLIDIHSHLVPGVDDGAKHVPAVLASAERMAQVGIRRVVTTPHIRGSLTQDPGALEQRLSSVSLAFDEAKEALAEHLPDFEYQRGHEVLIDIPEPDFSDRRIRMAGTSFVLVEWPRLGIPPGTPRVLRWIRDQGYRPIVAHPERYHGIGDRLDIVDEWRSVGAYLQVNYGSFVGRYGSDAQDVALRLLRAGAADYLSSDFHGQSNLKIYKKEAWELIGERGGEEVLLTLCRTNPERLLMNLDPVPAEPLPKMHGLMDRLRGAMKLGDSPRRSKR